MWVVGKIASPKRFTIIRLTPAKTTHFLVLKIRSSGPYMYVPRLTHRTIKNIMEPALVGLNPWISLRKGPIHRPPIVAKGTGRPWYWFHNREKCLWYNSVKIYNQKYSGDWTEAKYRIKQDLSNWIKDWKI